MGGPGILVRCTARAQDRPPNVLRIHGDDVGCDDAQCQGDGLIPKPNIDKRG